MRNFEHIKDLMEAADIPDRMQRRVNIIFTL